MKYIRTKDGKVIGFEPYNKDLDLIAYLSQFSNFQGECAPIQQDDNIVNLFDRFVICFPTQHDYEITDDLEYAQNFYDCDCVTKVYGAIFTEAGLIYVAKVNNKGKWELL